MKDTNWAEIEPGSVTTKTRLRTLASLDRRTHAAQQAHKLVSALEADLGGPKELTTAERELTKRAALLGAIIEDHEVAWLERRPADLTVYGTLVDRQRRCLEALGLGRRPRDVTVTTNSPPAEEYWKGLVKRAKVKSK